MLIPFVIFKKWATLKFWHDIDNNNNYDDLTITIALFFNTDKLKMA